MRMNSSSTIATLGIRIFGGSSFIFVSIFNLLLNGLLVLVLYKGRKSFSKNAFYTITWQLLFCDVTYNILEFIIPIPLTFAGFDIYGQGIFLHFPCFFETFCYNGELYFSFLMTINRITVFLFPKLNEFLFQTHLNLVIGLTWSYILLIILVWNLVGTYKTFSSTGFYYFYQQSDETWKSKLVYSFFSTASSYIPVFMFIAYILMILSIQIKLRWRRLNEVLVARNPQSEGSLSKIRREFELVAQAFAICAVLEVDNLVFTYIPQIQSEGQWPFIVTFAAHWICNILTSINAIVLFSFNRDIRRMLFRILSPNDASLATITVSHRGNSVSHSGQV